ncbi:acetylglutamate kinase [Sorangium cellulosum]|uniref:Acetylglutamate kinase n=1 Tax=Sorangium cellulosum TaxID=56 RepID=A0A4P2PTB8_SORCE|nr:acetylglutamate kinase [Sorangium cellulosum]
MSAMSSSTQDVIVRLLRNLGSRKEVEQYLKQYAAVDQQKFAVIKVGGAILDEDLEALATSLVFLNQVGLYPIVIHGAGPQLDRALAESGIPSERINGLRVTTPRILEVARRVFLRENLRLVEALEEMGTRTRPITAGVFEASLVDEERLGLVGRIQRVHLDAVRSSIRAGHLPILACLGETPGGQIVNINADVAARELALATQPFKMIFLTSAGGLLDEHGRIVSAINLEEDFAGLVSQPWLSAAMRLKLQEIKLLLDGLPATSSVSITSPDHLAKELFTHTGSGTLIRRGERILRHDTLDGIDRDRLRGLLEACFQRALDPSYFEKKRFYRIYLSDSYRATAILTLDSSGKGPSIPYLDKFAVTTEAQGVGIGGSLWTRMKNENPALFWRARNGNEVNPWYFQQAEGSYRNDTWTVFWYGLPGFDDIHACIDHALSLPATLRQHGTA